MSVKEKLLASAQKNLEKGQLAKAIKDFQQLVAADPKDFRSRQKLAELFSRARQNEQALEEYGRVARHYADDGFYLKAIAVYKQMQKLDPARPEIYHCLAELNQKQGLLGNAVGEYRTLVSQFEQKKMYPEAVDVLLKMKEIEPEDLNVRAKIVDICLRAKLTGKAREEFGELIRPLLDREDLPRALKMCDHFLPHFPEEFDIRVDLADLQIRRGEVDRGIHLLKDLLRQQSENPRILRLLAGGYHQVGDYQNERLIHQHLLKTAPDDLDARQALVRASLDQGDAARALAELEEWKETFCAAGRVVELRSFYEELRSALPGEPTVVSTLHSLYERSGQGEEASALFAQGTAGPAPAAAEPVVEELSEGSVLDESVEDLEEIAELTDELEELVEAVDEPEEVPLDFLETPASPQAQEEQELELELELEDGGLDLIAPSEIDPRTGTQTPAGEPESAATQEAETDLIDLALEAVEENPLLETELEEIEFYLQQDLLEEADRFCTAWLTRHPQHPKLLACRERIAERRCQSPEAEAEPADGGFFDMGAEILDEVSEAVADTLDLAIDAVEAESPAASGKTAKKIKTEVEVEDPESHYHLGIAYKEMGLLDEAVQELEKAMRDPARVADCLILKGICLVEKGDHGAAEAAFKEGLRRPDLGESEKVSLHFELGVLYESMGRPLDALDSFQHVADHDLFFREVGERISGLRQRLGLDEPDRQEDQGQRKKNRVSYV